MTGYDPIDKSPKKSYVGGGSMLKFFKQGAPPSGAKNDKANEKAKENVPHLFKQRKANV